MKRLALCLVALGLLAACAGNAEAHNGRQAIAFVAPVHAAPVVAFKIRNTPLRPFVGPVAVPIVAKPVVAIQAFHAQPVVAVQAFGYGVQQFNAGCHAQQFVAPVVSGHGCQQFFAH